MNLNAITIRSRNPMYYINDDCDIVEIPNIYDNCETIEINTGIFSKVIVPINTRITVVPKLGMFLFRTKDDALMFGRMLNKDGNNSLIRNSQYESIAKPNIMVVSSNFVKNGLYSIEDCDKGLTGRKKGYCYLNDDNEIIEIPTIKSGSNVDTIITEYVNRNKDKLDNVNLANNKLIFEVFYQNGKSRVTHYLIDSHNSSRQMLFMSDLNSYKIFNSKEMAKNFINDCKIFGEDFWIDEQKNKTDSYEKYQYRKEVKKDTTKKIFGILWGLVLNHKEVILGKGLDIFKKLLNKNKSVENTDIANKILDMINKDEVKVVE